MGCTQVVALEGEVQQHQHDLLRTQSRAASLEQQHDQDLRQEEQRRMCLEEDHYSLQKLNLQNEAQCGQLAKKVEALEAQLKQYHLADRSRCEFQRTAHLLLSFRSWSMSCDELCWRHLQLSGSNSIGPCCKHTHVHENT